MMRRDEEKGGGKRLFELAADSRSRRMSERKAHGS
jgi:hypothetical protein